METPFAILTVAVAGVVAVTILAAAGLIGWRGWLRLLHATLHPGGTASPEEATPAQRIELADLRERVRKLEAIAAGVEL